MTMKRESAMSTHLEVFDPPMCCSTGICGPSVDPALTRFAADLQWLASQGVQVVRYNLAQQPQAFVANPLVKEMLTSSGNSSLPLIVLNGSVLSKGQYLSRKELALAAEVPLDSPNQPVAVKTCCG
jgi:hypothetical protein